MTLTHVHTALHVVGANQRRRAFTFQELRELGAPFQWKRKEGKIFGNHLKWFWRSQIPNYHKHDRIFERWIARFLLKGADWSTAFRSAGMDGLDIYAAAQPNEIRRKLNLPIVALGEGREVFEEMLRGFRRDFNDMLLVMRDELEKLTPPHPSQLAAPAHWQLRLKETSP